MNICVVGYGYLGSCIGRVFTAAGHRVWGLRRRPADPESLAAGIQILSCDLDLYPMPAALPTHLDGVIYCLSPQGGTLAAYTQVYNHHLRTVLAWHHQHHPNTPFILSSSSGIYEQHEGETVTEAQPVSLGSDISKILGHGESYTKEWARHHYVVRFAGLYGPGRVRMIQILAAADPTSPTGQAYLANTLNLIHCVDAARLCLHLLTTRPASGIYNGVDSAPSPRKDIRLWLAEHYPAYFAKLAPTPSTRPVRGHKYCSNAKVAATGFIYRYPDFRAGLTAILAGEGPPPEAFSTP